MSLYFAVRRPAEGNQSSLLYDSECFIGVWRSYYQRRGEFCLYYPKTREWMPFPHLSATASHSRAGCEMTKIGVVEFVRGTKWRGLLFVLRSTVPLSRITLSVACWMTSVLRRIKPKKEEKEELRSSDDFFLSREDEDFFSDLSPLRVSGGQLNPGEDDDAEK